MFNKITKFNSTLPINDALILPIMEAGEKALAESDLFYANGLTLHENVPVMDLHEVGSTEPWDSSLEGLTVDYLICRGSDAIMQFYLADTGDGIENRVPLEGLPEYEIDGPYMAEGKVEALLDALAEILREGSDSGWRCPLHMTPEDLVDHMTESNMIEIRSEKVMIPTVYGVCEGLVRTVQPGGWSVVMNSDRVDERLYGCLIPDRTNHVMKMLARLDAMPLKDYLCNCWEEVKAEFPEGTETFGAAVSMIHDLMQSASSDENMRGVELMRSFAWQIIRRKVELDSQDEQDGLPCEEPEVTDPAPIEEEEEAIRTLMDEGVFLLCDAVTSMTGLDYPNWLGSVAMDEFPSGWLDTDADFGSSVLTADMLMTGDEWEIGVRIMYMLMIELFHVLHIHSDSWKQG